MSTLEELQVKLTADTSLLSAALAEGLGAAQNFGAGLGTALEPFDAAMGVTAAQTKSLAAQIDAVFAGIGESAVVASTGVQSLGLKAAETFGEMTIGAKATQIAMTQLEGAVEGGLGVINGEMIVATAGITLVVGALAALIAAVPHATEAWIEEEQAVTRLNSALAANTNYTPGMTQKILELDDSLEKLTATSHEALEKGQSVLLQFTKNLSVDQIQQATEAAIVLSKVYGMDLDTAFKKVGITIGTHKDALIRLGIEVNKNGTESEKLAQIMDVLGPKFSQVEANTNTLSGAHALLDIAMHNASEQFGHMVTVLLGGQDGFKAIANAVNGFSEFLKANMTTIERWATVIGSLIGAVLSGLTFLAAGVSNIIIGQFKDLLNQINAVAKSVTSVINGILGAFNTITHQNLKIPGIQIPTGDLDRLQTSLNKVTGDSGKAFVANIQSGIRAITNFKPTTNFEIGGNAAGIDQNGTGYHAAAKPKKHKMSEAEKEAQKAWNKEVADGKKLTEDMATATETYATKMARAKQELDDGLISQETYNRALIKLNPAYNDLFEALKKTETPYEKLLNAQKLLAEADSKGIKIVGDSKEARQHLTDAIKAADPAYKAIIALDKTLMDNDRQKKIDLQQIDDAEKKGYITASQKINLLQEVKAKYDALDPVLKAYNAVVKSEQTAQDKLNISLKAVNTAYLAGKIDIVQATKDKNTLINASVKEVSVYKEITEAVKKAETEQQKYNRLKTAGAAQLKDDIAKYGIFNQSLQEQAKNYSNFVNTQAPAVLASQKLMNDGFKQIGDTIESDVIKGFTDLIDGTSKGFADFASNLIKDIERIIVKLLVQLAVQTAVNAATGGAGIGLGSIMGSIGKLFGTRATGGGVSPGEPILVGERGPELFIPSQGGGSILTNNAMRTGIGVSSNTGQGITVINNINMSPGLAGTVRAEIQAEMPNLKKQITTATIQSITSGGANARALGLQR